LSGSAAAPTRARQTRERVADRSIGHAEQMFALRTLASATFLLDSLVIGLGAFGHGSQATHLHAAIDQFPIESDIHSMIYVVWYFVSGCMLAFGATLIWVWQRLRTGDRRPLFAALLGSVLLLSGYVLTRPDHPSES